MNRQFVVDYLRGTAAVSVLIVLPFAQLISVRIAPAFVIFAVLVCIGASLISKEKMHRFPFWSSTATTETKALALATGFLLLWSVISLAWGLDPSRGASRVASVVTAFGSVWFLGQHFSKLPIKRLAITYLLGVIFSVTALFIGLENTDSLRSFSSPDYQRYDYNRIAVGLCLSVWPLALLAKKGGLYYFASILLFSSTSWGIFMSESETAKLSLLLGLVVVLGVLIVPVLRFAVAAVMSIFVLAMPIVLPIIEAALRYLPTPFYEASHADHRLQIWKGASDLAVDKWMFGWGMTSDRILGETNKMGQYTKAAGFDEAMVGPHNLALELWINIGIVGTLPLALIIFILAARRTHSKYEDAAILGLFVATYVAALGGVGSTGLQGWFIFALAIVLTCLSAMGSRREDFRPTSGL